MGKLSVKCSHGKHKRDFDIRKNRFYIVDQLNPVAKKYRGERVKLIDYDPYCKDNKGATVLRVDSEWHVKRKTYTKMSICDLRPDKG